MKKVFMCLLAVAFVLLLKSPTYAKEYYLNSGPLNDSSYGEGSFRESTFDVSENVYPFLTFHGDKLGDLKTGQSINIGYVVIEDGYVTYICSPVSYPPFDVSNSHFYIYDKNGDTKYSGQFQTASLFVSSKMETNMPVFSVYDVGTCATDEQKAIIKDYFENGNKSFAIYSPPYEYPDITESNTVTNADIAYMYNIRAYDTHYWYTLGSHKQQSGGKELNEKYGDGYLVTWDCYNTDGTAIDSGSTGPITQDDSLNYRVEVRFDLLWKNPHVFKKDEEETFNAVDMYSNYGDMPYFYSSKYHFSDELIEKRVDEIISGKFLSDTENYTFDVLYFYFRVVHFDSSSGQYYTSPTWTRVSIGEYGSGSDIEEGILDNEGNWIPDPDGKSYHLDDEGNITDGKNLDEKMLTDDDKDTIVDAALSGSSDSSVEGFGYIRTFLASLKEVPSLVASVFNIMPAWLQMMTWFGMAAVIVTRIFFNS